MQGRQLPACALQVRREGRGSSRGSSVHCTAGPGGVRGCSVAVSLGKYVTCLALQFNFSCFPLTLPLYN